MSCKPDITPNPSPANPVRRRVLRVLAGLGSTASAAWLAGCASVTETRGVQVVKDRLLLDGTPGWNRVNLPTLAQPYEVWTREGILIDQMRLWAGLPSGVSLHDRGRSAGGPGGQRPRNPTFTAGMPADRLVAEFEAMLADDGSLVELGRVQPAVFVRQPGVRFEFDTVSSSGLRRRGFGLAAEHRGQLYAATWWAPRLHFHAQLAPEAETLLRSARLKA